MPEVLANIVKSKSKTFLTFCFCFIFGASIFSFVSDSSLLFYLYVGLFAVLFFLILFWHKNLYRFVLACLVIFILGGLRLLITIPKHNSSRVEFYNGDKVALQGWVAAEPDIGLGDARYIINVVCKGEPCQKVVGKVIIKTRLYPQFQYGERLQISCLLQEPTNFADSNFNYQKYLAKQEVWSVCANPKVVSLGGNSGNVLFRTMFNLKSGIQNQMSRLWPEPNSSLLAGILYGSRSTMPQDLVDNFTRTGVTHIVAVSGYNVSIIVMVLNIVLIYIGLSRRQSFWFLLGLILTFVFFTGATASVVRAGVMAAIVLAAQYMGRLSAAGRTLVYAAVIMLIFNPYVLIWDAGFQLSFLSTLGLVYLSPILESIILKKTGTKTPSWLISLVEVLVTTISAIIATLPLILFQFGRLSLVAPLVNVLVLWIIPWLMLFGFISLILSFLIYPVGQTVAWVVGLGLNYVIIIVNWFGGKNWSAIDIQIPIWLMIGIYAGLIYFIVKNLYGKKSKSSLI